MQKLVYIDVKFLLLPSINHFFSPHFTSFYSPSAAASDTSPASSPTFARSSTVLVAFLPLGFLISFLLVSIDAIIIATTNHPADLVGVVADTVDTPCLRCSRRPVRLQCGSFSAGYCVSVMVAFLCPVYVFVYLYPWIAMACLGYTSLYIDFLKKLLQRLQDVPHVPLPCHTCATPVPGQAQAHDGATQV